MVIMDFSKGTENDSGEWTWQRIPIYAENSNILVQPIDIEISPADEESGFQQLDGEVKEAVQCMFPMMM